METHYDPGDLEGFNEIGKDAPGLAEKFFDGYAAVFAEGELTVQMRQIAERISL